MIMETKSENRINRKAILNNIGKNSDAAKNVIKIAIIATLTTIEIIATEK